MRPSQLITMDWIAGGVVGLVMLSLHGWLAELYSLPRWLIFVIGVANLSYASVSFTLACCRNGERVPFLRFIAVANLVWAIVCVVLAMVWFREASVFGIGQFLSEAFFVGGLGLLEWRASAEQVDRTN